MRRSLPLLAVAWVPLLGGCAWTALHLNNAHHMTVERAATPRVEKRFRVVDAETSRPVPGARVTMVHDFDWVDDWPVSGTTGHDGIATLRLAARYLHTVQGQIVADGYLGRGTLYFGDAREAGTSSLADDPVDVRVFRAPAPVMGLRVPAGFRGTVIYRVGEADDAFPFPPDFPPGQRVWWSDARPGADNVVEPPPALGGGGGGGGGGGHGTPVRLVALGARVIPTPVPGAELSGVAAWHVGVITPGTPWNPGRPQRHVLVIGDRAAALAEVRSLRKRPAEGPKPTIDVGWLRIVVDEPAPARPEP